MSYPRKIDEPCSDPGIKEIEILVFVEEKLEKCVILFWFRVFKLPFTVGIND